LLGLLCYDVYFLRLEVLSFAVYSNVGFTSLPLLGDCLPFYLFPFVLELSLFFPDLPDLFELVGEYYPALGLPDL